MSRAQAVENPTAIGGDSPTNDSKIMVDALIPYIVEVTMKGTCPLIFHRWSNEDVKEKGQAAKGSSTKKTDNVESYVYRNKDGFISLPGIYLRGALVNAAKFIQDPRSSRKSAADLYKAGVQPITALAPVCCPKPTKNWEFLDQRRVTIQRNGITRSRPAFEEGWEATVVLSVLTPQYISPKQLQAALVNAGMLVGVGDFRPTYGRFSIIKFDVKTLAA